MTVLQPCPWCGGNAEFRPDTDDPSLRIVACVDYGKASPSCPLPTRTEPWKTDHEAAAEWNRLCYLQAFAEGLRCPHPKCASTGGRIVCQTVEMEGFPMRYAFCCMSCLFGTYASPTPDEARAVFLRSGRTIAWNDNKGKA